MDMVALKFKRNKRFTIQQFEQMEELERENYKKNIVCNECGADAYYRIASKDGKVACFGANHILGCETPSKSPKSSIEGSSLQNEVEISAEYNVSWNYINKNKNTKLIDKQETDIGDKVLINTNKYVEKPGVERKNKISLSTIHKCAEYQIINDQNYFVTIPERGQKLLRDVVARLEEINDNFLNKEFFVWGKIYQFTDRWLNTSYLNNISILIDDSIQEKFWRTYKTKMTKLLNDESCSIIVFGKVKKSKGNKYYIHLTDIKYFHIGRF